MFAAFKLTRQFSQTPFKLYYSNKKKNQIELYIGFDWIIDQSFISSLR